MTIDDKRICDFPGCSMPNRPHQVFRSSLQCPLWLKAKMSGDRPPEVPPAIWEKITEVVVELCPEHQSAKSIFRSAATKWCRANPPFTNMHGPTTSFHRKYGPDSYPSIRRRDEYLHTEHGILIVLGSLEIEPSNFTEVLVAKHIQGEGSDV